MRPKAKTIRTPHPMLPDDCPDNCEAVMHDHCPVIPQLVEARDRLVVVADRLDQVLTTICGNAQCDGCEDTPESPQTLRSLAVDLLGLAHRLTRGLNAVAHEIGE